MASAVTDLTCRIEEMITPTIEALGFQVVCVRLFEGDRRRLQVMAEPASNEPMTVDHCAKISRAVSALLEVEDPISGAYDLEVSSPGVDRPLVRPGDFERFAGFEAKVELDTPIDGRKRFRGQLLGLADDKIRIMIDGEPAELPFPDIKKAKLVMTDDLLAAVEGRQRL